MGCIGARHVGRADRLKQFLAVMREDVDCVGVVIDDPHALRRVVRTDVDGVRSLVHVVPLRPVLDEIAGGIDHHDGVVPARVDAHLAVRRRGAAPKLHALRGVLARAAGAGRGRDVGVAPRQARDGILHAWTDLGQHPLLGTGDVGQFAAAQQEHAVWALGKNAARAAEGPLFVTRQGGEVLRPASDHFVRAGDILLPDGTRNRTERDGRGRDCCGRSCGLRLGSRLHHAAAESDADRHTYR